MWWPIVLSAGFAARPGLGGEVWRLHRKKFGLVFVGFLWFGTGFCGQNKGMDGFFLNGDGSDSSLGDAGVGDYASKMVGVVLSCSAWTQPMKQRKAL